MWSSLILLYIVLSCTTPILASTFQMRWSTDFDQNAFPTTFGPDGPWQGVVVNVGNSSGNSLLPSGVFMALYFDGGSRSLILTPEVGGNYSIGKSSSVFNATLEGLVGNEWGTLSNGTFDGPTAFDYLAVASRLATGNPYRANATILSALNWTADGEMVRTFYRPQVGVLALGPPDSEDPRSPLAKGTSILSQMKTAGQIGSNSFGFHIGSVPLNQPGSMILGGYDSERIVDQVGVFQNADNLPIAFLLDVRIGTEGVSPFDPPPNGSFYRGIEVGYASRVSTMYGAPNGSAVIIPNPSAPYIYLPIGTCEAVASFLPVTWNEAIELYTWNTEDPRFTRIINSLTYLEIILADKTAANISVKVPFKLLNLTLEPPLIAPPTSYFPCKPLNTSSGIWALGRAFLQAAFVGINYEQNLTFIAQAPGPNMGQIVTQPMTADTVNLSSSATSSFVKSWSNTLTILPVTSNTTNSTSITSTVSSGLSAGAKAGISIAAIVAAIGLVGTIWWLCRRQRKTKYQSGREQESHEKDGNSKSPSLHELDARHGVSEASRPLPHEIGTQEIVHEAPTRPPSDLVSPVELGTSDRDLGRRWIMD